jgi:hypothetical protein
MSVKNDKKSVTFQDNEESVTLTKDLTAIPREKFLSPSQLEVLKRVNIKKFPTMKDGPERNAARNDILHFNGTLSSAQVLLLFLTEGLISYNMDNDFSDVSMEFYQFSVPANSPILDMISSHIHAAKSACKTLKSKFELKTQRLANGRIQVQIIDNYPKTLNYIIHARINAANRTLINWVLTDNSKLSFDDCFFHADHNKSIMIKSESKHILCSEETIMKQIQKGLAHTQQLKSQQIKQPAPAPTSQPDSQPKVTHTNIQLDNWSSVVGNSGRNNVIDKKEETVVGNSVLGNSGNNNVVDEKEDTSGEIEYLSENVSIPKQDADYLIHNLIDQLKALTDQVKTLTDQAGFYYGDNYRLQTANQELTEKNRVLEEEVRMLKEKNRVLEQNDVVIREENEEMAEENNIVRAKIVEISNLNVELTAENKDLKEKALNQEKE